MAQRYYILNGFNDPNLKNTFIATLLEELQLELQRALLAIRRDISDITIGEIYYLSLTTLDKLCEQLKLFYSIIDDKTKLQNIYKKPSLQIKCKDKQCQCPVKKKSQILKHKLF